MINKEDKSIESLENNFQNFQNEFQKIISDYKRKSKRLDKIIKQSDKQQLKVILLNEELDEYKNHLELKVKEKTKELNELNLNLEERVKEEVKLNRIKDKRINDQAKFVQIGELMSNIAHHWRQPLNAISTSASGIQLMRSIGISNEEEENESITQIVESTKFLSSVIQDFADFVNDNQNSTISEFSIQENINKSLNIIISSLENHNINIVKNYPKDDIIISSIGSKLSNIFLNLLKNAQDALLKMEDKITKTITISIIANNKAIKIKIKDNANGINEDILPKIFDPYFTTKHQSAGTGLGLYTVKDDIEQHLKGNIQLNNSKNGVEVLITLPKKI
jgi:signal transduction histidine kinase